MYMHVRVPRNALAVLALFTLIALGPSLATAALDAPAPITNGRSKATADDILNILC